jgi:tRNA threonylcarbamoyladenosine biosynthesis protein TsaB
MSVLAIDTSSRSRVVAVVATPEGGLLESEVIRGEQVAASLPRVLGRMLGAIGSAVVVVTGPGTYTGVRAGMAAALGVAHARHLPLHGVATLEVVACGDPDAGTADWVIADAGRGALYVARAGDAANPSRVRHADFDSAGARVLSTDRIEIAGIIVLDAALALARAIPLALARPALDPAGLSALYVD